MAADPRWTDEAMAAIVAAITDEAKHHPGDETCEDRCVQDEAVCMAASVHLAASIDGVVRSVYASPERLAEVALNALAEAGVLLPPGGQTEPRFGRFMGEGWGFVEVLERAEATHQRTWTTWPDESEHFTPWVEVSPDA